MLYLPSRKKQEFKTMEKSIIQHELKPGIQMSVKGFKVYYVISLIT